MVFLSPSYTYSALLTRKPWVSLQRSVLPGLIRPKIAGDSDLQSLEPSILSHTLLLLCGLGEIGKSLTTLELGVLDDTCRQCQH